jgi:hypothetical protein
MKRLRPAAAASAGGNRFLALALPPGRFATDPAAARRELAGAPDRGGDGRKEASGTVKAVRLTKAGRRSRDD